MTSKEALRTIANTKTNHIKSEKIGQPRVMYLVKEERKKELKCIKQDLDRLEELENENKKLKKAIEVIMLWRDEQIYDLIDNLKSQDIQGYEILEEVLNNE